MLSAQSLTLYVLPHCPYCVKVEKYIKANHIEIETKNVEKPQYRAELIKIGGKPQVPCLVHDGKALYESDDIIVWLKEHVVDKRKS